MLKFNYKYKKILYIYCYTLFGFIIAGTIEFGVIAIFTQTIYKLIHIHNNGSFLRHVISAIATQKIIGMQLCFF